MSDTFIAAIHALDVQSNILSYSLLSNLDYLNGNKLHLPT